MTYPNKQNENFTIFHMLMFFFAIPLYILSGWVLSILWGWFLVPIGMQEITPIHGAGIALIINFVTTKFKGNEKVSSIETVISATMSCIVYEFLCLFIGYILHVLM